MSRGGRVKRSKFKIAVFTLSALLLIGVTAGLAYVKFNYNQAREYQRSSNPDAAYKACFKIPFLVDTCTKQYEASTEKDRDDDDLAAQQEMADWAFAMLAVSTFGLILSFGGLILVYRTLQKTAESVDNANRQIIIENRPWIRIEPRESSNMIFDENGGHISFQVIYNNIGNSPALRLSLSCGEFDFYADDIVGEIDRFKSKVKADFMASEKRGETVFPNETSRANGSARVRPQTIAMSIIDPKRPNIRLFSASFIFSVLYQSAIDDTIFQTTIVMSLIEDSPDGMMRSIPIDNTPIPRPIPFMQMQLMVYPGTYEAS